MRQCSGQQVGCKPLSQSLDWSKDGEEGEEGEGGSQERTKRSRVSIKRFQRYPLYQSITIPLSILHITKINVLISKPPFTPTSNKEQSVDCKDLTGHYQFSGWENPHCYKKTWFVFSRASIVSSDSSAKVPIVSETPKAEAEKTDYVEVSKTFLTSLVLSKHL